MDYANYVFLFGLYPFIESNTITSYWKGFREYWEDRVSSINPCIRLLNQIILLLVGNYSESIGKIETVQSIHAKKDEEPESVHSNIDHDISNYKMFSRHNIPNHIIDGLQYIKMSILTLLPYVIMTGADV